MKPDCFLDTNILFYAAMGRYAAPAKYARARDLVAQTHFALSGQVLQELFVNVTRKSDRPLTTQKALECLESLADRPCAAIDLSVVIRGAKIAASYQISYRDGAIVAAAEQVGAPILYSEDLNHGQVYGTVRVVNPFKPN